jgi:hypothetical protein
VLKALDLLQVPAQDQLEAMMLLRVQLIHRQHNKAHLRHLVLVVVAQVVAAAAVAQVAEHVQQEVVVNNLI